MPTPEQDVVSLCLKQLEEGDESAAQRLLPHIYDDLRALARVLQKRKAASATLQPTAIVHEAYARLFTGDPRAYEGRTHFMKVAALAMRQLLADYAREQSAKKRGGDLGRVTLDTGIDGDSLDTSSTTIDLIDLENALTQLQELQPRQARVVELRFLTGLTVEETAEVLGISVRTAKLDWQMARAWLSRALDDPS